MDVEESGNSLPDRQAATQILREGAGSGPPRQSRVVGRSFATPAVLARVGRTRPAAALRNWHGHCLSPPDVNHGVEAEMAGNDLFGVHGAALAVRSARMGVLASNIANASTPGFKARDVDFRQALAAAGTDDGITAATKYRVPLQTSLDGNTVELSQEQTAFAENAIQYQTTLSFLNGRINTLTRALKGE
jgi:flagellar basal-body rod protein FlgB